MILTMTTFRSPLVTSRPGVFLSMLGWVHQAVLHSVLNGFTGSYFYQSLWQTKVNSFQRVTFLSIIPFSLKTLSVTLQGTNAYWPSVFSSWSWNKVNQLQTDSFETTCMQSVMIHGSEVRIESAESHCSAVCSIWKGWVLFYFSLFSSNLSVVVTLTDSFEHFPSCPFFTVTAGNLLAIMEPLIFDILFRVKMMCLVVVKEVDGNGWM